MLGLPRGECVAGGIARGLGDVGCTMESSSSLSPWKTPSKIVQDALQYGTDISLLMHSKERGMFRKQKQWKLTSLVACAG